MGFSRQEYWSGLSFPSLGDLPDPGIDPTSAALTGRFFTTELPGKLESKKVVVVIVQLLSSVWLFVTPWTTAHQASLSFTISQSLLKLHVCWVSDAIKPFYPLSPTFPPVLSFPPAGSFPMSWLFASGGQSIGASASASILPMNIQGWFPLGITGQISLQFKGRSRVFSNTSVQKHLFFGTRPSLWYSSHIHTWLKWKGESCVLHSHKLAWERAMILLSVRKQAGAKFLWPRLRRLLDLWREGYQHRRGAEDSHTSELYWAESWHSSRTCCRRMLLRRKALSTTRRGKWCPSKKKPFVLFANLSPPGLKLKGVGEKRLSLKHDLRAKGRALHRMLTVPSTLDLGRLVNWAESHRVMESDWTVVKRSKRAGVKMRQRTVEGSGGKIKTPLCSVHSKVLTVPDTGGKHINGPHPSSQKPWCFHLWWPPAEAISVYSCNFN